MESVRNGAKAMKNGSESLRKRAEELWSGTPTVSDIETALLQVSAEAHARGREEGIKESNAYRSLAIILYENHENLRGHMTIGDAWVDKEAKKLIPRGGAKEKK